MVRRTKILATLGPASSDPAMLVRLVEQGADAFRLNFSHGTAEEHATRVAAVRALEARLGRPIGLVQDLQGPKIRLGTFADPAGVLLAEGATFRLTRDLSPGDASRVGLPFAPLFDELAPGCRLLLNDGLVELRVVSVEADGVTTVVVSGGPLSDRKGVNVPELELRVPALSDKDLADVACGAALGVDWVALSFVRSARDVEALREELCRLGSQARIMAKIEKPCAVERYDAILDAADGILIARGDLGVELPEHHVPVVQKRLLREAVRAGKPVVVATQMLESMIHQPRPTRAEASDVANAIYDGADAVMLSSETAVGAYPAEAVAMMRRIALDVEASADYQSQVYRRAEPTESSIPDAVSASACRLAELLGVSAIACTTLSGATPRRVARYRPPVPIFALTPSELVARQLTLSWGVVPRAGEGEVADHVRQLGLAQPGEPLVVTAGADGRTSVVRVLVIGERQAADGER
ncbi:MAG: pyruvate kinase [Armatimonadetes bacterium]|nr:pyruvate kinase [Armatimonadota bacterium]